jgi:hypothetical protein
MDREGLGCVSIGGARFEGRFGIPESARIPGAGSREGRSFMFHITCDLCGKQIPADETNRYVVKMEIYAARDPSVLTDADLEEDHMEAVSNLLREEADGLVDPDEVAPAYKNVRYDLCPSCHKKFVRDPLGKEAAQKFDFSEN